MAAITDKTILISMMWANNETGMIFPSMKLPLSQKSAVFSSIPMRFKPSEKVKVDLTKNSDRLPHLLRSQIPRSKRDRRIVCQKRLRSSEPLARRGTMGGKRAGTLNVAYIIGMGLAMKQSVGHLDKMNSDVRALTSSVNIPCLNISAPL